MFGWIFLNSYHLKSTVLESLADSSTACKGNSAVVATVCMYVCVRMCTCVSVCVCVHAQVFVCVCVYLNSKPKL